LNIRHINDIKTREWVDNELVHTVSNKRFEEGSENALGKRVEKQSSEVFILPGVGRTKRLKKREMK